MKKFIAVVVLVMVFSTVLFSQQRVNKPQPKLSATLGQLTSAKGWSLQPDGQWLSRQNRIPIMAQSFQKSLMDIDEYGLGIDNFIFYQIRNLSYNESDYVIVIKKIKHGLYRYPSIEKEWRSRTDIVFAIFEKDVYEQEIAKIKDGEVNKIEIKKAVYGNCEFINDQNWNSKLTSSIVEAFNSPYRKDDSFIFHIAPYKSKNIVQFNLFMISEYNMVYFLNEFNLPKRKNFFAKGTDLENCYYEATYTNFNNFIKLE